MITWSLASADKIRMSADTSCAYEASAEVRAEVRDDARILAKSIGRPVTVLDALDQVQEVVTPASKLAPKVGHQHDRYCGLLGCSAVSHDEPGITRDRVMR